MSALGILVELIGYAVARATLPLFSFGWIHVEPFGARRRQRAGLFTVATRMDGSNCDSTLQAGSGLRCAFRCCSRSRRFVTASRSEGGRLDKWNTCCPGSSLSSSDVRSREFLFRRCRVVGSMFISRTPLSNASTGPVIAVTARSIGRCARRRRFHRVHDLIVVFLAIIFGAQPFGYCSRIRR